MADLWGKKKQLLWSPVVSDLSSATVTGFEDSLLAKIEYICCFYQILDRLIVVSVLIYSGYDQV